MGPALQGAAVIRGGQSRPPLRTLSLRASLRREASALGVQTGAAIRSPALAPLDKSGGMGIIINRRGRCIRRSVPVSLKLYLDLNDPQKPSPCPVAVFAFQSLDSYRDRMTQNMNRKHEKHTVPPPFEEVTNRLTMYAASLRRVYIAGGFLSIRGEWLCPTLDKPAGMGIIINTRGRCDKRSAPSSKDLHQGFTPQKKPSLGRVAVSSFQLLNSDRD